MKYLATRSSTSSSSFSSARGPVPAAATARAKPSRQSSSSTVTFAENYNDRRDSGYAGAGADINHHYYIPSWTPELEAQLEYARAALKAANKRWSPEQEVWYPEVERLEAFKRTYLKSRRKSSVLHQPSTPYHYYSSPSSPSLPSLPSASTSTSQQQPRPQRPRLGQLQQRPSLQRRSTTGISVAVGGIFSGRSRSDYGVSRRRSSFSSTVSSEEEEDEEEEKGEEEVKETPPYSPVTPTTTMATKNPFRRMSASRFGKMRKG